MFLNSKMTGLRSKQKSAGEVRNHHSSDSSGLSEGRCFGGEGRKTFTSAAACCVLIFVVELRSRRGGLVLRRVIRIVYSHILNAFPCLYVPTLNLLPLHLKPQMGHLKIVFRFSSSLTWNRKTSLTHSAKAPWEAACSYSPCPFLLVQISTTMNS